MTGLIDDHQWAVALSQHLQRASRAPCPACVLLVDLDHFARVNADHGRAAGDALLRAVGLGLARRLRASDVAARLGGDQFAVLLWAAQEAGAIKVGWDLIAVIDQIHLNSPEPAEAVTASVGLVVLDARARHAPAIMDSATVALAQAKAAGGHQVAIAHHRANDQLLPAEWCTAPGPTWGNGTLAPALPTRVP